MALVLALVSLILFIIHGTNASYCPSFCTCNSSALLCTNGYNIHPETLHLVSPDIEIVKIDDSVIRSINKKYFERFHQLQRLEITDCRSKNITGDSLSQLLMLTTLNFAKNHISELPEGLLASQTNLTWLDVSHNSLDSVPETLFTNNRQLQTIRLNSNRLRLLPEKVFDGLTNLIHLNLAHNELSFILPRTFSFISVIRYIDLTDNLLVTLHPDLFDSNNETVNTKLTVADNPLDCNCGLIWLHSVLHRKLAHIELLNASQVFCWSPRLYKGQKLEDVPLERLNCTQPSVRIEEKSPDRFHGNEIRLECHVTGSPYPSIVWTTPMHDDISDPYRGQWIDNSVNSTDAEKKYQIYATGETIHYTVESLPGYSQLTISSMHLVSSGQYRCLAINPGGSDASSLNVTLVSSVEPYFYPSLVVGAITVASAIVLGVLGCAITACIERCTCCESMVLKYYDGTWMNCDPKSVSNNASKDDVEDDVCIVEGCDSDEDTADEDEGLLPPCAASTSSLGEASTSSHFCPMDINEHTALTADVWDSYFRQYPDDFVVESFDASPKKFGSPQHSAGGSPTHRSHGKTLETLEGVRVRLKLRKEQIDVMKERLRIHMEKRSARMKENIERRKERMNKKMQTIRESTSQSLQSIKETGRNYSHKLHMGVRTAMENVGAQVQSLKEFCGTGDLGQTLSIATITTDIDTNESTELTRSVTMV